MNISALVRSAKSVITANSPVLLVGTAVAGVVATGVLAAKGGYKARDIVIEAEAAKGSALDLQEKVKLTWLCYAVPAVTAASTIASVAGVHVIHTKRHNAFAALYAVTSNKLDDYTARVEEMVGPKKTQQLRDETAQAEVDRSDPKAYSDLIITPETAEICFEPAGGRWFTTSLPKIEEAVHKVNMRLATTGATSLNEFYDALDLQPSDLGDLVGWAGGTELVPIIGSVNASDGRPALSLTFRDKPKVHYSDGRR